MKNHVFKLLRHGLDMVPIKPSSLFDTTMAIVCSLGSLSYGDRMVIRTKQGSMSKEVMFLIKQQITLNPKDIRKIDVTII